MWVQNLKDAIFRSEDATGTRNVNARRAYNQLLLGAGKRKFDHEAYAQSISDSLIPCRKIRSRIRCKRRKSCWFDGKKCRSRTGYVLMRMLREFKSALLHACEKGNLYVVELILNEARKKFADDDFKNLIDAYEPTDKMTPLWIALSQNRIDLVNLLIENGANVNHTIQGKTLLMLASSKQYLSSIVKRLIEYGAEINAQDETGQTALMIASKIEYDGNVRALLSAGADKDIRDNDGRTALTIAKSFNNIRLAQLLDPSVLDTVCPICLEDFSADPTDVKFCSNNSHNAECKVVFHKECYRQWASNQLRGYRSHNQCPHCRTKCAVDSEMSDSS